MQYHLDTIPVWEAMEWKGECPLCSLERKTEVEEIERTLGASVMEPDVRIRFNERGVCGKHQQMLFAQQNKLGHALLMDSRVKAQLAALQTLQKKVENAQPARRSLFGKGTSVNVITDELKALQAHCVVCEAVNTHMRRYRDTFLHLWKTNSDFRAAWKQSNGVCLPHLQALLETSGEVLSAEQQNEFTAEALAFLTERLANDEKDLDWFTRKFDYRFQAEPWGESKTAVERAVNRLRGWCVGSEPYPQKK